MNTDDISRALRRQATSITEGDLRGLDTSRTTEESARPTDRTRFRLLAVAAAVIVIAVATTAALSATRPATPPQALPPQAAVLDGMTFHSDQQQVASGACGKDGYVERTSDLKSKTAVVVVGTITAERQDTSVLDRAPSPTSNNLGTYTPEVTLMPRIVTVKITETISGDVKKDSTIEFSDAGWIRSSNDDPNWYPLTMDGTIRVEKGQMTVLALQRTAGSYHLTCSGAFAIDANGRLKGSPSSNDPLVNEVNGLTVAEFAKKVVG